MNLNIPSVSGAPWLQPLKHSGKCPFKTFLAMLGVGLLSGVILGVLAYFGGYVTFFIAKLGVAVLDIVGESLGGCTGTFVVAKLFPILGLISLEIMYPALLWGQLLAEWLEHRRKLADAATQVLLE